MSYEGEFDVKSKRSVNIQTKKEKHVYCVDVPNIKMLTMMLKASLLSCGSYDGYRDSPLATLR